MKSIEPEENKWSWRNCRSLGIAFEFWLWPWVLLEGGSSRDRYGGQSYISIGPITFTLKYNVGTSPWMKSQSL